MSEVVEIDAARQRWRFDIPELWSRRDLLLLLLQKDLVASHKQSILGPAWHVLQPLAMSLVFGMIFGRFARLAPPTVPDFPYFLAGMVLWTYFQSTVLSVSASLPGNSSILEKIYFPRLIIPLVAAGVSAVHFAVNYLIFLVVCAGFLLFTEWSGAITFAKVPLLLLMLAFLALSGFGIGIWMAAWSVTYRDLRIGMGTLLTLWMFATPIIWPLRMVPADKRWIFALNPMTSIVEMHRSIFFGTPMPSLQLLAFSAATCILALVVGLAIFGRKQSTIVDTL